MTFLSERIQETISGYTASTVVSIYGDDLDQLDREASQIARVLSGVPGATDVSNAISTRVLRKLPWIFVSRNCCTGASIR